MRPNERIVKLCLFVGSNGSGKSHQMKLMVTSPRTAAKPWPGVRKRQLVLPASRSDKQWSSLPELKPQLKFRLDPRDPRGKRELPYYVIPGINTFTGTKRLHIEGEHSDEIFRAVVDPHSGFRDGALFADDFKNYVPTQALLPGIVRSYFGNRRMHMVDIFMAAWSFQDINAEILGFNPQWFIFNVTRPPNASVRDKVDDFEGLMRTWRQVQQLNANLPEGRKWAFLPFPAIQNRTHGNTTAAAAGHR